VVSKKMPRSNKRDAATPRAPIARSRVSNGREILPGVDGRSPLARRYGDVLAALVVDQGGADHIPEARMALCRLFAFNHTPKDVSLTVEEYLRAVNVEGSG
jgi:hypothetical protein